ncbi:MAG TPA: glucan 1,4-alpha-glucosidase [Gemmatimonadales bacterium]|nr:glucan 1,4-alpha-glucosidase [Gemmatimonadales bacterium]
MTDSQEYAPGWPGIPARWTSSAKSGVGTALTTASRVWFTLSHGVFNEIYYPRNDVACVRDLGFIVTDTDGFVSEEKRHAIHEITVAAPGVPLYRIVNTCEDGRYRIEKRILADPLRDAVVQRTRFTPLKGTLRDYRLFAVLAPHLGNAGAGNTAWVGDHKGRPMLFAQRGPLALALACSGPWRARSAGFVGTSDGWQSLTREGRLDATYRRAENGNVALTGEIDLDAEAGEFALVLGFGDSPAEAGSRALAALLEEVEASAAAYQREWEAWQAELIPLDEFDPRPRDLFRASAAVIKTHESKAFPGAVVASLSIPWGQDKGDSDMGGYHLVWPRDLTEAAGGLLAAGARSSAHRVLQYLEITQDADGHWPQNMWHAGTPYWDGVQMDETALPILLIDLTRRELGLPQGTVERFWPMVRRAAAYIVRNGPVTQEDRWEEEAGYSPFTLAVEIAALVVAADLAEWAGEASLATYLRETADLWNANVERWTYVAGDDLARRIGVAGYYVRVAPPESSDAASPAAGFVAIKNRPAGEAKVPYASVVSPDALALVRCGLRRADDPRIADTVKVVDALLKVDTPFGPCWHRYNGDGYGEHADGSAFDGTGIGRLWPLLTGERGHYELAAGRRDAAERLLGAMERFASDTGLLPEQIWGAADIPARELYCGRPTGSAMPLVWAHAEYVKLRRSLSDGRVFDCPLAAEQRYAVGDTRTHLAGWRFNQRIRSMPRGRVLRVDVLAPARIHWGHDGWRDVRDTDTRDTGVGTHVADLPTAELPSGARVDFTLYWLEADTWEGRDYQVTVE